MLPCALLAAAALVAQDAPARRALEFPEVAGIPEVPVENPHDYRGTPHCAWCHEGRDPAAKGGDPIALCAQCHAPSNMKHPFGVAARSAPAALPLGAGGKIVCHTCHDPHDVKAHRRGLRLEYGALCKECHAGHARGKAPSRAEPPPSHGMPRPPLAPAR